MDQEVKKVTVQDVFDWHAQLDAIDAIEDARGVQGLPRDGGGIRSAEVGHGLLPTASAAYVQPRDAMWEAWMEAQRAIR